MKKSALIWLSYRKAKFDLDLDDYKKQKKNKKKKQLLRK